MKIRIIVTLFLSCYWINIQAIDTLKIAKFNKIYFPTNEIYHLIDSTNTFDLTTVQNLEFGERILQQPFPIENTYWLKFFLPQEENVDYQLYYPMPDSMTFFMPNKNGNYSKVVRGGFTDEEASISYHNYFYFSTDSLEVSKPIYIKVRNFSKWGRNTAFHRMDFMKMRENTAILNTGFNIQTELIYATFLAIVGFIFIYFLIQFCINKRLTFFLYSCYLITLFVYLYNRFDSFFFWQLFDAPVMFTIVNENAQIFSSITYLLFMNFFLDVKNKYPKFQKYLIGGILTLVVFMLIYNAILLIDRFNPIHLNMMTIFRIISSVISIWFLFVVIKNKPRTEEWIALGSGVILMLSAIIPPILGNIAFAIPFFLGEILVLAIGLAYQVRKSDKERLRTKEELITQLEINVEIQQKMQLKLEEEVKAQTAKAIQKTREAEQAKSEQLQSVFQNELEKIKMKALQAQMNPHFLFNCLNSIRLFYLKNETKKADAYITKFSRLLRLMLRHSRADFISLQEELDALKLYIEFEQMRFKDKFEYDISINNNVKTAEIQVQPLTIQPFVENAIWHGLMQSDKKGKLSIQVNEANGFIKILVADNGIGRQKAKAFKAGQNQIKTKSFGLSITKERMELMQKTLQKEASFEIIDLLNEQEKAIGTRVEITYGV